MATNGYGHRLGHAVDHRVTMKSYLMMLSDDAYQCSEITNSSHLSGTQLQMHIRITGELFGGLDGLVG